MAGAAVRQSLREVGTAIPLRIMTGLDLVAATVKECHVPQLERPAHGHRPCSARGRVDLTDRAHAIFEVRVESLDVLVVDLRIGNIWHRWIQVLAIFANTVADGAIERGKRPRTEPALDIGRDTGSLDGDYQRDRHRQAAGIRAGV